MTTYQRGQLVLFQWWPLLTCFLLGHDLWFLFYLHFRSHLMQKIVQKMIQEILPAAQRRPTVHYIPANQLPRDVMTKTMNAVFGKGWLDMERLRELEALLNLCGSDWFADRLVTVSSLYLCVLTIAMCMARLHLFSFFFFSVRLLSVLRGHSFFSSPPNGQWPPTSKDFYPRFYQLHYFLISILVKEPDSIWYNTFCDIGLTCNTIQNKQVHVYQCTHYGQS